MTTISIENNDTNHNITIITSFMYIENNTDSTQLLKIINHLSTLLETNIPICIFVDDEYFTILENHINNNYLHHPHICIKNLNFCDTWIFNECSKRHQLQLPSNRNHEKDNRDFILSGHTKHECIMRIAEENPFNTTHFMWMDNDIAKIFHTKKETLQYLRELSTHYLKPEFITFPGCWSKLEKSKVNDILHSVHWRFCGGFILGSKNTIISFCKLYNECVIQFFETHNILTWDFNLWAWMETEYEDKWSLMWYKADHNDSIVFVSGDIYTRTLEIEDQIKYDYPVIETYYSTSACYLYYNNKHYLNTRYVNYWIYPSGCYLFASGSRLIENKNILSELENDSLKPIYYKEIREHIEMPINRDGISIGLEDIRLYEYCGKVKYIATTLGYSQCGKSRIIVGNYDIENTCIIDGDIIHPQHDTWCEKNWIPIVKKNRVLNDIANNINNINTNHINKLHEDDYNGIELSINEYVDEELFIYKWYPLEIGKIEVSDNRHTLNIVQTHSVPSLVFSKIRGSSIFQEIEDGYIGVVHFSEEHSPRHYYHMMVILDKDTLCIKQYSESFCFEKLGIEFCIGFKYLIDNIVFWISRHDRDPITLWVKKDSIKWINIISI